MGHMAGQLTKDTLLPHACFKGPSTYGRTRHDGYLTKKLKFFAILYVHIVDYSTTFDVHIFFIHYFFLAVKNVFLFVVKNDFFCGQKKLEGVQKKI